MPYYPLILSRNLVTSTKNVSIPKNIEQLKNELQLLLRVGNVSLNNRGLCERTLQEHCTLYESICNQKLQSKFNVGENFNRKQDLPGSVSFNALKTYFSEQKLKGRSTCDDKEIDCPDESCQEKMKQRKEEMQERRKKKPPTKESEVWYNPCEGKKKKAMSKETKCGNEKKKQKKKRQWQYAPRPSFHKEPMRRERNRNERGCNVPKKGGLCSKENEQPPVIQ